MKKRILSIIVISMTILSMTACGSERETDENPETKQEETTSEDEMSQSEWMESKGNELMEDGYEKVDTINIDSGDTKLEYLSNEKFTLEDGEEVLLVNFKFSNISAGNTSVDAQYNFTAFQDGVEMDGYYLVNDEVEGLANRGKEILDGASINIAICFTPQNWETPIKLRVDDNMAYDEMDVVHTFQQQEIEITQ